MHSGAVSGKGGFSLVAVYGSEIHCCARNNVTVMSTVTEVPGKCKSWVNIMPYLLWNRITVLRKVALLQKSVLFSSLASIIHFDTLKVEKKKKGLVHQEYITSLYHFCPRTFGMSGTCYMPLGWQKETSSSAELEIIYWKVSSLKLQSDKGILISETIE